MKIILHTTIAKLEERFTHHNWRKNERGQTECDTRSLGWYVQFAGSTESICLWETKPEWKVGDRIKITFERDADA